MMSCGRCAGLMKQIYLFDFNNETDKPFIEASQCLNCGEIVDRLILLNREDRPRPYLQKARTKKSIGFLLKKPHS